VTTVLLVGTGQVGTRAARQLIDTPEVGRLLVASRDASRAADLAEVLGGRASVVDPGAHGPLVPEGVDVVALATVSSSSSAWVRAAVEAGVPVAAVADEVSTDIGGQPVRVAVRTGAGLGPGLSEVLVRHAADDFDAVDEVHVARVGVAGPACAEAVRAARRATPGEWRDGAWYCDRSFGPELLWFPDPVGARECQLVGVGTAPVAATVPGARHVTVRLAAPPPSARWRRRLARDPVCDGWGAVRIEVTGWRNGVAGSIVYGMVDRTEVVAGSVLAVTAATLAGAIEAGVDRSPGVRPLGAATAPVPFLAELARRGVSAATFEGVVPH
jgi:hypothetical protein